MLKQNYSVELFLDEIGGGIYGVARGQNDDHAQLGPSKVKKVKVIFYPFYFL